MADRCAGCTNKYGYFERPSVCPECHKGFCQSCLPYKGKKVKKSQLQVSLEPCVYCRRQKAINKAQEAEILTNFQERYYDRAHIEAPIQSKLRLDLVVGPQSSSPSQQRKEGGVQLSEEDKALEERLKRLKESNKKANTPSYTEEEMRDKLEKLRDEGGGGHGDRGEGKREEGGANSSDHGGSSGGEGGVSQDGGEREEGKPNYNTQTERADRLMEQASEEVRIDQRVEEAMDADLLRRFQQLKGTKDTSTAAAPSNQRPKVELDIQNLLEDMDVPAIPDEDPEKLLQDLQAFQSREEAAAIQELSSSGVQDLIKTAQKLAAEEREERGEGQPTSDDPLAGIVYPNLPEPQDQVPMVTGGGEESSGSHPDVVKMLEEGRRELKLEQDQAQENAKFIQQTSDRLGQLRAGEDHTPAHDIADDDVVKSKPKSTSRPQNNTMDFTWSHFGGESTINVPSSAMASSAARQLGVVGGRGSHEEGEEFDQEVQGLIAQMLEEAELDNRLEASGLNCHPEPSKSTSEPSDGGGGGAVGGASALPPPAATGGGASRTGGGACGVDELPWCCICNDDATICCYDCDDDLYCQRCFSEGHQQFGLYNHQYAPFQMPQK